MNDRLDLNVGGASGGGLIEMTNLWSYRIFSIIIFCSLVSSTSLAQPRELLVVEKKSSTVGFYTTDGKQLARISVGQTPHEMVFSPEDTYAYVSDNGVLWMSYEEAGGNTISIVDVRKRKKVGVIDLGEYRRPHGLDIDPQTGRLVATIENPDGLLLVDPEKRQVLRKYDVQGKSPHMVTLGPRAEWAYVSNTGSATVAAVHLESGQVKLIPTDGRPQGGVLSPDGKRLYITNSEGNSISIIDTDEKKHVDRIKTGEGPGRIGITPDARQLVYNLQAGEAVGFADIASGKQVGTIALPGPPLSLHLTRDGKWAYTGVQSLDRIFIISVEERKITGVIHTPEDAGPDTVVPIETTRP